MSTTQIVQINGRNYDAITGLAVTDDQPAVTLTPRQSLSTPSHRIHKTTHRSQTLSRHTLRKPAQKLVRQEKEVATSKDTAAQATPTSTTPKSIYVGTPRSQAISKFAQHPRTQKAPRMMQDIAPVAHPAAAKAHAVQASKQAQPKQSAQPKPSQVIKNEAIDKALTHAPTKHAATKKAGFFARHPRAFSVGSASLALLLLGGYFTYINLPSLSVRVAAAQAGIEATYPEYKPDGYSLDGPVAYSDGSVSMKFAANGGPQSFTIMQAESSYDSQAVLNNYVKPRAGENYMPFTQSGLTIYAYGGDAAWVNGGILYTIDGDAPLSNDQIRRIAQGM